MTTPHILPISPALREATPDSISELYSRDVESLSDADIDRIIEEQRANRSRMEAAEAAGKKPRTVKSPRFIGARQATDLDIQELDI